MIIDLTTPAPENGPVSPISDSPTPDHPILIYQYRMQGRPYTPSPSIPAIPPSPAPVRQVSTRTCHLLLILTQTSPPPIPPLTPPSNAKTAPPLDREARLTEGIAQIRAHHAEWTQAWAREDLHAWSRILTAAMRVWRRTEKSCQIHREDLAVRVSRSTTYGGSELWNLHHYRLDVFERKTPGPTPGGSTRGRQPRTAPSSKRLLEEMANVYEGIAVNMGAIREIATKKMRGS